MESYPNPYSALIATFNQVSPADSPSKDDLDDVQNFPDDDLLLWANAQFTFDIPPEGGIYEEDASLKLGNGGLPGDQQQQPSPHSHDPQLQHHRQLLIQKQQQLLSLQLQQQQLQQQQQQLQQQPSTPHPLQYRHQPPPQHSFHHVETAADPRTLSVLERSRQRNPIPQLAPNAATNGTDSAFHGQTLQQQQLQQALHYHHSMIGLYPAGDAAMSDGQQTPGLQPLSHHGYPGPANTGANANAASTNVRLARSSIPSPQGTQSATSEAAAAAAMHDNAALSPKSETGSMSLAALQITTPPVSSQAPAPPPPSSSSTLASSLPVTTPVDEHVPHLGSHEVSGGGGGGESSDEDYDDFEGGNKDDQGSTSGASATSSLQRRSISSSSKVPLSKDDPEYAVKLAAEEDKRRRNTAASARFRQKKRLREQALERTAKEMTLKSETLEARVKELEMEIKWLRGLIIEKDSRMLENMPPIKAIVAAAASSSGAGDDASESSNSSNKRGASAAGGLAASTSSLETGASGRKASSRRTKAA
ncbi:hypothetical protein BGZ73_001279 [Actinomortierella ambigua]|nr:hypothetical protein BGZ73_001279 [Actinomortierella ambigua]